MPMNLSKFGCCCFFLLYDFYNKTTEIMFTLVINYVMKFMSNLLWVIISHVAIFSETSGIKIAGITNKKNKDCN